MKILFVSKNFREKNTTALEKCDPNEFVMVIDVDRCISCGACNIACQLEHGGSNAAPGFFSYINVRSRDEIGFYHTLCLPSACRSCEFPCDYYRPYNFWITCPKNHGQNKKNLSCDLCADRIQMGLWPACATRCSMKTIYFGYARDMVFVLGEKRLREMGDVEILG